MAKQFKCLEDATEAVFLYLQNVMSVHDITSKYEVNTFRLYEAIDGDTWVGAQGSAVHKLKIVNPKAYSKLPTNGKLRRGNFGKVSKPLPLFG